MARQVLPIVGAVVGAFFGSPQIGFAIGSIIGNAVDPQVIKGPRLGEAGLQTSAEGVFRPVVIGTGPVKGNVIDRGNRRVVKRRQQQSKGGPVTEEQRVFWTFAIRICEGPIGGVLRIWQDEKLVYDIRQGSTIPAESADYAQRFRLYLGDEDHLPDPDLEVIHGDGNAPAYRGSAYIVFPNFDLTDFRERIPDFRFEVTNEPVAPYTYVALLHMDERFEDTSSHLRDEVEPTRWSPGGDLVPAPFPFGENALEVFSIDDVAWCKEDFATLIGTQPFCISAWINRDSSAVGKASDCILGHWYAPGTRSFQFNVLRFGDEYLELNLSDDGSDITLITGDIPVPYDEWVYVAVTRDHDGVVRLWQQVGATCVQVGSGDFPWQLHSNAGMVPGDQWGIGGYDLAPEQNVFAGLIKELVIIVGDPIYTESFAPPSEPWPNPATGDASTTVGHAVSVLHGRVGQTTSTYDISELTDPMFGLVLAGDYTCADAIRTLMGPFFFDASEHDSGSGYKIHYVKRGKPVALTITDDDLIEAPEKSVREDALERPRVLHLHYENPLIGYAPAKATNSRDSSDVRVVGERSIAVPVVFNDVDVPAKIAAKLMKVIWSEVAGLEEFTVPDSLLALVPTDCIGVLLRGQTRRMRIAQEDINPGTIGWRLINDRQSAYTSNVTGVPLPPPTPPLPSLVGQTVFEFLDIPALNDGNDALIWYEAASGQTEAWFGAQTQRKVAPAVEFEDAARFTLNTILGVLVDPVTAASEHYTDTTNVVRVQLLTDDSIDSLTQQQFLSEGGAFALEKPGGGWEVMQYRDADDEGDRTFALSTLLRGRLNSGPTAHVAGARFVLLDAVKSVAATTAMIGADVVSRAVSFGNTPEGAVQYTNTFTAKSQTEFPVAHLIGSLDGGTLHLRAVPRHRFGTEDNPVQSVNWVGYRWTVTDGANSMTVDGTATTLDVDVSGWSTPITATVAQVNRFTGPGPTVSEQFE